MPQVTDEVKKTPLSAAHEAAGGKMVPFAGFYMPVSYRGITEEHRKVRSSVGLFDLSHMGEFRVTGLEVANAFGFWGIRFSNPEPEPPAADIAVEAPIVTPEDLLEELGESPQLQSLEGQRVLEAVWCGLVEQLEERKVFTRAELVASIRKIAQQSRPVSKAQGAAG